MPFEHYVGESSPNINTEQNANWQPIGAVARMLVERAAAAGIDITQDSNQAQRQWDEIADREGLPRFDDIAHDVARGLLK